MKLENMLIKQCEEKGIDVIMEGVDFFEKIKFTFSKDGKHFTAMYPTRDVLDIPFKETWIKLLIKKAEAELNH